MALSPQIAGTGEGIDLLILPPVALVAVIMEFTMMDITERNGELIAHLASQGMGLGEGEMMGLRGSAPADDAGLACHILQMSRLAQPLWFRESQRTLVDAGRLPRREFRA